MHDPRAHHGAWTVHHPVRFGTTTHGAKRIRGIGQKGGLGAERDAVGRVVEGAPPAGRVPRVTRLMALAVQFECLLREGVVRNQAELAARAGVSRARVTQIMNFRLLAPDIQEAILALPRIEKGRDRLCERDLRPIMAELHWDRQRSMWATLVTRCRPQPPA